MNNYIKDISNSFLSIPELENFNLNSNPEIDSFFSNHSTLNYLKRDSIRTSAEKKTTGGSLFNLKQNTIISLKPK